MVIHKNENKIVGDVFDEKAVKNYVVYVDSENVGIQVMDIDVNLER